MGELLLSPGFTQLFDKFERLYPDIHLSTPFNYSTELTGQDEV